MKVRKHPLRDDRIRRPPREGWSWIDRRFLREHAPSLERDAVLLYFFLAAVSDKYGLSYYGDESIAGQLRLSVEAVLRARQQLEFRDLIAFSAPLYQVLSMPVTSTRRSTSEPGLIGNILHGFIPEEIRSQLHRGAR